MIFVRNSHLFRISFVSSIKVHNRNVERKIASGRLVIGRTEEGNENKVLSPVVKVNRKMLGKSVLNIRK